MPFIKKKEKKEWHEEDQLSGSKEVPKCPSHIIREKPCIPILFLKKKKNIKPIYHKIAFNHINKA